MNIVAPDMNAAEPAVKTIIRPDQCSKCKFALWQAKDQPFECRRMPPTATTFMIQRKPPPAPADFVTHTGWPRVNPSHWCGEYKPSLAL